MTMARLSLPLMLWIGCLAMAAPLRAQEEPDQRDLDEGVMGQEIPEAPPLEPESRPADKKPAGKLKIVYTGNKAFSAGEIRRGTELQIATVEEFGLDASSAYDLAYFVEVFYRQHGYSQVEVTEAITGPWSLRLDIAEGSLTRVGTIGFKGNRVYDYAKLLEYLLGPTRERFPRIRNDLDLPFVEADIQDGIGLIRRLYGAEGYLDAVIPDPRITMLDDFTRANIEVEIEEGIEYRFGSITFVGMGPFSREQLMEVIAEETSKPFTIGRAAAAVRAIEDFYQKNGYYEASATVEGDQEIDDPSGIVDLTFRIEPGALYRFDGVAVSGNRDVPTRFIENRLKVLRGQPYNPEAIDKRFRELIQTGLFQNLRITPEPVHGDELRLDVSVEEAKAKEFGIGVGYSTFLGGIFSLSFTDRNFLHSARPLSFTAELTQRGINGEFVYSNPWLFETDYQFKLHVFARAIRLEGYSKQEIGIRPTLLRQVTKQWQVSAFAQIVGVALYDVLIEPVSLVGPESYSTTSIGISQTLDFRNDPVLPTSGFKLTSTVDFAPTEASDVPFVRGTVDASYYLPITRKTTLAFGARGGIISPLNSQTLPIDERFFNGGATTVRSYPELKLGPKDHVGYPLGGETFTVFNVEYTFPIWQALKAAVFMDAGNVISDAADFGLQDMQYAVGAGLRYDLPVGPIRLDYGYNPAWQPGEPQGAFHFSIGLAF